MEQAVPWTEETKSLDFYISFFHSFILLSLWVSYYPRKKIFSFHFSSFPVGSNSPLSPHFVFMKLRESLSNLIEIQQWIRNQLVPTWAEWVMKQASLQWEIKLKSSHSVRYFWNFTLETKAVLSATEKMSTIKSQQRTSTKATLYFINSV